jgi:hypothetical protein
MPRTKTQEELAIRVMALFPRPSLTQPDKVGYGQVPNDYPYVNRHWLVSDAVPAFGVAESSRSANFLSGFPGLAILKASTMLL